jgi:hypothetical protein
MVSPLCRSGRLARGPLTCSYPIWGLAVLWRATEVQAQCRGPPDRMLVLESRGLLEGQLKKVGAKFGVELQVVAARLSRAWPANTSL